MESESVIDLSENDQERESVVFEIWMTMDPQEERLYHLQAIPKEAASLAPAGNPPEMLRYLQAISKEATSSCTLVTKEGERTEVEPTFLADLI